MFVLAVPKIADAATVGTVTANPSLNLRQSAATSTVVLLSIPKNTQVNILSKNESNWYNITYNGKSGWVSGQYLSVTTVTNSPVTPTVTTPPAPSTITTVGTVTANPSLKLRTSAVSGAVITSIPKNAQVNVLSKNGSNWYNVTYNGKSGWVSGQYLSVTTVTNSPVTPIVPTPPSPTPTPTPTTTTTTTVGTVTANPSLKLRTSAESGAVITSIPKNAQVNVLSKNGSNWYNVIYNGKNGWVSGAYLSLSPIQVSRSDSSELVQHALSLLGVPYVFGGTSHNAFDCSGYTQYVFMASGISLPRTTFDQYRMGSFVDKVNLQAGDLVFFTTYAPGASHVGIYIGGGNFVAASNSGVIISNINSSYYASRYLGARRVS